MGTSTDRVRWREALRSHTDDPHPFILTLEAFEALALAEGRPPTFREVARTRQVTAAGIQHHVAVLRRAGLLIGGDRRSPRSLRVCPPPGCTDWLPAAQVRLAREATRGWSQDDILKELFNRMTFQLNQVDLVGSDIEVRVIHKP